MDIFLILSRNSADLLACLGKPIILKQGLAENALLISPTHIRLDSVRVAPMDA
jgi:hypothetical protein